MSKLNRNNLIIIGVFSLFFILYILLMYPGGYSYDSVFQLKQATGQIPLNDAHPIITVLVWKFFYFIGLPTGSLFVFQYFMFMLGLCLIGLFVYKKVQILPLSLSFVLIPFIPCVFLTTGMVWKNVGLMSSITLFIGMLLFAQTLNTNRKKLLVFLSVIPLAFGAMIIHFSVLYIFPLVMLWVWHIYKKNFWIVLIVALFFSTTISFALPSLLVSVTGAKHDTHVYGMFGPDLIHISTVKEVNSWGLNTKEKEKFMRSYNDKRCGHKSSVFVGGSCYDSGAVEGISASIWLNQIKKHPKDFIFYKLKSAAYWLFYPSGRASFGQNITSPYKSPYKITQSQKVTTRIMGFLTETVMIFTQAKWLVLLIDLLLFGFVIRKKTQLDRFILSISASSALNILMYLPLNMVLDYRFILWSTVGTMISILLLVSKYIKTYLTTKQ